MAMVVVGVLAGIVVTALGGYTLYKIFTRLQRDTETRRLQQQQGMEHVPSSTPINTS